MQKWQLQCTDLPREDRGGMRRMGIAATRPSLLISPSSFLINPLSHSP
jgi:hypothetical protein